MKIYLNRQKVCPELQKAMDYLISKLMEEENWELFDEIKEFICFRSRSSNEKDRELCLAYQNAMSKLIDIE